MNDTVDYKVIGLMSGTSLDGLDIAYCKFRRTNSEWNAKIDIAYTVAYNKQLIYKLSNATNLSAQELDILDHDLGKWMGDEVNKFIKTHQIKVDFISSHGHTVFHQPKKRYTLQIGNGADLHQATNLPIINDFRSLDVANGGQGAPLVPIGDWLLFGNYDACINLGGIANISKQFLGERIAFDICPVNMMLNYLAEKKELLFDDGGSIARSGLINESLLSELNSLNFYRKSYPKSLGYEWVNENIFPLIKNNQISIEDRLATCTAHAAKQIAQHLPTGKVLITGGGTFNKYLIECIENYCNDSTQLVIPNEQLVNFKEALVFAFLGVLKAENEVNTLKSVTGASADSCGGKIIGNIKSKR